MGIDRLFNIQVVVRQKLKTPLKSFTFLTFSCIKININRGGFGLGGAGLSTLLDRGCLPCKRGYLRSACSLLEGDRSTVGNVEV